jgi:hypothetical protein
LASIELQDINEIVGVSPLRVLLNFFDSLLDGQDKSSGLVPIRRNHSGLERVRNQRSSIIEVVEMWSHDVSRKLRLNKSLGPMLSCEATIRPEGISHACRVDYRLDTVHPSALHSMIIEHNQLNICPIRPIIVFGTNVVLEMMNQPDL